MIPAVIRFHMQKLQHCVTYAPSPFVALRQKPFSFSLYIQSYNLSTSHRTSRSTRLCTCTWAPTKREATCPTDSMPQMRHFDSTSVSRKQGERH